MLIAYLIKSYNDEQNEESSHLSYDTAFKESRWIFGLLINLTMTLEASSLFPNEPPQRAEPCYV
ncbi:4146_t:CDS:2 [Funneliformis geosporum]|uniref:4146_t:CDS:1 n=1 Tax=Funneliformis geosporum TaxID=1117311 RepID=A0A9W4SZ86_9GLOM|nr:4146_t:CDS:2 [Funneliformis geosporum]